MGAVADEKPWSGLRAWGYSLFNRNPASNRLVVELARLTPTDTTLDIGCGPGAAVRAAAQVVTSGRAHGVDASAAMVRIATRRSAGIDNVLFEEGAAESLPFADARFDAVWTVHAFHHWPDPTAGLAEARRVLAPGGRLLIIERHARHSHGLSDGQAADLRTRLEELGFVDVALRRHGKELVVSGRLTGRRPLTL